MKAVIVERPLEIRIADVPKPEIQKGTDVLVRVLYGSICGSDIGIYRGTNALATYPRIIGHEYGGVVEEIGADAANLSVGDVVAVDPVRACGNCYACSVGRPNVCKSVEVTGVHRDGGFAEYVVAPASAVYKIDTAKVDKSLISLVEPYSIGAQVCHRADIHKGDKVLVMGAGPIGVSIMQVAKSRGAVVMITDIVGARLERAAAMGADVVVNVAMDDLDRAVDAFTGGEGMPVVVDSVCSTASFEQSVAMASQAGRVVTLGLLSKPSAIAMVEITKKELDIRGSRLNNHRFPEVIRGFEDGSLTPAKMLTSVFHFTEVERAIAHLLEHPELECKVALRFD
jgi:L-gulonate 5-dehydrogenase